MNKGVGGWFLGKLAEIVAAWIVSLAVGNLVAVAIGPTFGAMVFLAILWVAAYRCIED